MHCLLLPLQAEAEAAAAEGSKIEIPLEDGRTLVVTPGQGTARDSAGDRLYELTWAQDADGALSVCHYAMEICGETCACLQTGYRFSSAALCRRPFSSDVLQQKSKRPDAVTLKHRALLTCRLPAGERWMKLQQ